MKKLGLFFLTFSAFGLVDYTDDNINDYQPASPNSVKKIVNKPSPKRTSRGGGAKWLTLTPFYESLDIRSEKEGSVAFTGVDLELRTQSSIYFKGSYYQAASSSEELTESGSYTAGNPELLVGINWLDFTGKNDGARFDLIAGARLKETNGTFASSRNDQIIGLETSKSFQQFVLGLGIHYTLTGTPDREDELSIGNITNYKVALGWFATPDIRFSVETNIYNITEQTNEDISNRLEEEISFSSLSSKVYLGLSPSITLVMGGVFRTDKLDQDREVNYLDARLYGLEGAYGNSLFSSLSFSL